MSLTAILKFVSVWSIVLPFIAGLLLFKKLNYDSKIILLLVVVGIIPQIFADWILHNEAFKNITYNLYTPCEFGCYALLFRNKFISFYPKRLYKTSLLFFTLLSLYLIYVNNISTLFLNQWVIFSNIFILFWAGMYLFQLYSVDEIKFETNDPLFWYLIALVCYASCTTVFFSLWYIVLSSTFAKYHFVVIIHHIFNINLYFLFFVGILKNIKGKKADGYLSR